MCIGVEMSLENPNKKYGMTLNNAIFALGLLITLAKSLMYSKVKLMVTKNILNNTKTSPGFVLNT